MPKRKFYESAEDFRIARVQRERFLTRGGRAMAEFYLPNGCNRAAGERRIQTRQICFAWNLLPPASPPHGKLTGKMFMYTSERVERLRKMNLLRKRRYENQWPHEYELESADRLVGEMGIRHPNWWVLASEEFTDFGGLTSHFERLKSSSRRVLAWS